MPNWNRLDPRRLETLVAVLRHGTTSEAARILGTTQPNVSKQLKSLEESLGVELFERKHGRLQPTIDAIRLGHEAERMLNALDDLLHEAQTRGRRGAGSLRVAALPTFANTIFPEACATFIAQEPDVDLYAAVFALPEIHSRLREGDLDLAIVHFPQEEPDIGAQVICSSDLVAVFRVDDPLASETSITKEMLKDREVVTYPARLPFARAIRNALDTPFGARRIQSNYTSVAVCLAEKAGLVAVVDSYYLAGADHPSLVQRPLEVSIPIAMGVIFSRVRKKEILSASFIAILNDLMMKRTL